MFEEKKSLTRKDKEEILSKIQMLNMEIKNSYISNLMSRWIKLHWK